MLKHKYNKIKSYEKIPTNFGNLYEYFYFNETI